MTTGTDRSMCLIIIRCALFLSFSFSRGVVGSLRALFILTQHRIWGLCARARTRARTCVCVCRQQLPRRARVGARHVGARPAGVRAALLHQRFRVCVFADPRHSGCGVRGWCAGVKLSLDLFSASNKKRDWATGSARWSKDDLYLSLSFSLSSFELFICALPAELSEYNISLALFALCISLFLSLSFPLSFSLSLALLSIRAP